MTAQLTNTPDPSEHRAEKPVCPRCNGARYIDDPATGSRSECSCRIAERMWAHFLRCAGKRIGPDILHAATIFASPLYESGPVLGGPIRTNLTGEDVHLIGSWGKLLPHVKLALCCTTLASAFTWAFSVVTDAQIIRTRHDERSHERDREPYEQEPTRFSDVVLPPDLLIIRLGFMCEKLKDSANIIHRAVREREAERKPTWLISDAPGAIESLSWQNHSKEFLDYVTHNLREVTIP